MPRCRNLSRHSGVLAFETTDDSNTLTFLSGERHACSARRPGRAVVEPMKSLAQAGRGLATYASQQVRDNHDRKL